MKSNNAIIRILLSLIISSGILLPGCLNVPRDNDADMDGENYNVIYSDKMITEFSFINPSVPGIINEPDSTIRVFVPHGTVVSSLTAEFTTNAQSVDIQGRSQISGITVNDFSKPLTYNVTAQDGSSRVYTVTVEPGIIVSFSLADPLESWAPAVEGVIDHELKTITLDIPYYMNRSCLVASFITPGDATINDIAQESGVTQNDFTASKIYKISLANGITREYTVTAGEKETNVAHLAGTLGGSGNRDGVGNEALFYLPYGVTSDVNNIYVTDSGNHTIRKIVRSTGAVTTIAGSHGISGTADGEGTSARFNSPWGIVTDGENLYVTDSGNDTIRKIVISTGVVSTIAGIAGSSGLTEDANGYAGGITSKFDNPRGITTNGTDLFVVDSENYRIRKIVISTGVVSTIAGNGTKNHTDDTNGYTGGITSEFYIPSGITTDGPALYVTETGELAIEGAPPAPVLKHACVRRIEISTGIVSTIAGDITTGYADDGDGYANGITSRFCNPYGIASDGVNLYITERTFDYYSGGYVSFYGQTIRKIVISTGVVSTIAGTSNMPGWTNNFGTNARFNWPNGITVDSDGANLYIADTLNHTIRVMSLYSKMVCTLAGSALETGSNDGTGSNARFNGSSGITSDGVNLYVADTGNHTVRKIVIATGQVITMAGSPGVAGSDIGNGAAARFNGPTYITINDGNLYVSDTGNNTIRMIVISTGDVTTIAGSAIDPAGFINGPGVDARFDSPNGITTDGTNLYIADRGNDAIRMIEISSGNVSTLAGGTWGWDDGTGTAAKFGAPYDLTYDGTNIYVADGHWGKLRKIVPSSGVVTTINVSPALNGYSRGITSDGVNLYISESGRHVIRKIVLSTGAVTTVSGTAGNAGHQDGPGLNSLFNYPGGIIFNNLNLYVFDGNNAIRVVTP